MFCIKPYLNETEGRERGGGWRSERRVNRAPPAGGERTRGSPPPGPAEGRAGPAESSVGSRPRDGAAAGRSHLPERGSPGRPGPGSPLPSPGSAPGLELGGDGRTHTTGGAAAPLFLTNCNKRAIRSDSQGVYGLRDNACHGGEHLCLLRRGTAADAE